MSESDEFLVGAPLQLEVPFQRSEQRMQDIGFPGTSEKQYCLSFPPLKHTGL